MTDKEVCGAIESAPPSHRSTDEIDAWVDAMTDVEVCEYLIAAIDAGTEGERS